jgi:hypothetical protein
MDFEIESAVEGDVLVVTFSGRSTKANAGAMTGRYLDIVRASGSRKVLADIRRLEGRLTHAETYFLVRNLPMKPLPAGIKTAVLEMPERRRFAEFLEATSANAGIELKSFVSREEALAWLLLQP